MAGHAFLRGGLAASDVGIGKQLSRPAAASPAPRAWRRLACLLRHGDLIAGFCRLPRRKDRAGGDVDGKHSEAGAQDRAQDLVQFKGVHRFEAPRRSQKCPGCEGAWRRTNSRFASSLATRITREVQAARKGGPPAATVWQRPQPRASCPGNRHGRCPDPHSRAHGFEPTSRQAARRHRRRTDDRACPAAGAGCTPRAGRGRH